MLLWLILIALGVGAAMMWLGVKIDDWSWYDKYEARHTSEMSRYRNDDPGEMDTPQVHH